tara:strand:- start:192 stop:623 length:432 start_codon:yes stop_codon:yes gene_type:complete
MSQQGGFVPLTYNPLEMSTEDYDIGSRYSNSLWVPVAIGEADKLVTFSGQVWCPYDGGLGALNGNSNIVARIIKNGYQGGTTIGTGIATKGPFQYDWNLMLSMQDIAHAGDSYGLYLYVTNGGTWVDGNPLHTFWCGSCKTDC